MIVAVAPYQSYKGSTINYMGISRPCPSLPPCLWAQCTVYTRIHWPTSLTPSSSPYWVFQTYSSFLSFSSISYLPFQVVTCLSLSLLQCWLAGSIQFNFHALGYASDTKRGVVWGYSGTGQESATPTMPRGSMIILPLQVDLSPGFTKRISPHGKSILALKAPSFEP